MTAKRITAAEAFATRCWPVGTLLASNEWRRARTLVEWNRAPGGRVLGVVLREVKSGFASANRFDLKTLPGDVRVISFGT